MMLRMLLSPVGRLPASALRRPLLSLVAALAVLALAGCGGGGDTYDDVPVDFDILSSVIEAAPVAPPPPSDEIKPEISSPRTQIWRPGHWVYEGGHFNWIAGEVLTRPSPTAVWSQDRWEHRGYGWVFIHGYWQ